MNSSVFILNWHLCLENCQCSIKMALKAQENETFCIFATSSSPPPKFSKKKTKRKKIHSSSLESKHLFSFAIKLKINHTQTHSLTLSLTFLFQGKKSQGASKTVSILICISLAYLTFYNIIFSYYFSTYWLILAMCTPTCLSWEIQQKTYIDSLVFIRYTCQLPVNNFLSSCPPT